MLRFRRYRIFWILAVFVIGALYRFKIFQETTIGEGNDVGGLRGFGLHRDHDHEHDHGDQPAAAVTAPEEIVSGVPELRPKEKDTEKEAQKEGEKDGDGDEEKSLHDSPSDLSKPTHPIAEKLTANQPEKVAESAAVDPNEQHKPEPVIDSKFNASPAESSPLAIVETPKKSEKDNAEEPEKDTPQEPEKDTPEETEKDDLEEPGKGRLEVPRESSMPKIYWSKLPEHFPIPSASIIQLPTGKPKTIANIQHVFSDESPNDKIDREQKLVEIKKAFGFSWAGYKDRAWMKDELSPVSGGYRNPFCGWAATLVDSLDTLWIMDMKEEFEQAVNSIKDIDFTTNERRDIPVFETVIRYLGGLLSAYDLSGVKYRVLLDKAVELAEILMGAFDTPNRMPIGYYNWKPAYASQPHRARTRTVLAEIGSLSVEFTRLAQLTKEPKYYDAIARITNELAAWQNNTKLPGLWPLKVDASGCKKPDAISSPPSKPIHNNDKAETDDIDESDGQLGKDAAEGSGSLKAPASKPSATVNDPGSVMSFVNAAEDKIPLDAPAPKSSSAVDDRSRSEVGNTKRQSKEEEDTTQSTKNANSYPDDRPVCEPQGLASPPGSSREEFSMGGQADSAYEYLSKEYMLLGGLEDVYRRMYEMAVETAKKYLLFRPMLPEERNVLLLGTLVTSGHLDNASDSLLKPEGTHLTCFAGGMFAVGAKIFNREGDMDIARKLTNGCVWAYEATLTGIMPEVYLTVPCESQERCEWNETKYLQTVNTYLNPKNEHFNVSKQLALDNKDSKSNENSVMERDQSQKIEAPAESKGGSDAKELGVNVKGVSETKKTRVSKRQLADLGTEKVMGPERILAEPTVPENLQEAISIDDKISGKTEKLEGNSPGVEQKLKEKVAEQKSHDEGQKSKDGEQKSKDEGQKTGDEGQKTEDQNAEQKTKEQQGSEDGADETSNSPPTPTSQGPENARVIKRILPLGMASISSSAYILRPEAIESIFIMYRITGDNYWREKGWAMFEAIRAHTTSNFGASGLEDVTSDTIVHLDVMESFWLAETLKYFYLLFSDPDLINLDDYVLNTEAHPLKRPKSGV